MSKKLSSAGLKFLIFTSVFKRIEKQKNPSSDQRFIK